MTRLFLTCLLFWCAAGAVAQSRSILTPGDAERAEEALKSNSGDVALRSRLIAYYYGQTFQASVTPAILQRRRDHILWLAEHHPETALLGAPEGAIEAAGDPAADAGSHAQLERIWRKQIESAGASAAVLANAAYTFRLTDREFAANLLARAMRLEPAAAAYRESLGVLYAEAIAGTIVESGNRPLKIDPRVARAPFAIKAREQLEETADARVLRSAALHLTAAANRGEDGPNTGAVELAEKLLLRALQANPQDEVTLKALSQHYRVRAARAEEDAAKISLSKKWLEALSARAPAGGLREQAAHLDELAQAAYQARDRAAASEYANELLALVQKNPDMWNSGDAAHRANTVLGLLACDRGDLNAAIEFLRASARVPRTPLLSSFGPSMLLANCLLQKEKPQAVLEYFRLCEAFWELGKDRLAEWGQAVRAGEPPDFGTSLAR